jgi:multiple sugar transport system substrate-binding protein
MCHTVRLSARTAEGETNWGLTLLLICLYYKCRFTKCVNQALANAITWKGTTMKVAKKWLLGLGMLAPMALVVAGCAPAAEEAPAPAPAPAEETESEGIPSDIEATLVIWYYDTSAGLADIDAQVAAFNELYPNVTFELEDSPGDQFHGTKLPGTAVTQEGPDIIWYNPQFTKSLAEAGVLAPLDEEWAAFADAGQFPDAALHRVDGSIYGMNSYVNLNAMWYNQDILTELGLEVPTTLDELEAAMAAGTAAGYKGFQFAGTTGVPGEWNSRTFFSAFGVGGYDDYDNPAVLDMFNRVTSWVDEGYVNRSDLTLDQGDGINKFLEGDVMFYLGGNWQLSAAAETATFEWGVAPTVSGPGGEGSVYLGGQAEAVGAFTTNKALAWEFLAKTWMNKEHGVYRLGLGSIPLRADALEGDVTDQQKAYAAAAQVGIPLPSDTEGTLAVGTLWSGLMQGQLTPDAAFEQAQAVAANTPQ